MNFNCFPVELHHQVVCFMDPEDILALRKTSKYFLALTHKPHLWTSVYHRMRQTHPLSYSQSEFAALSSCKSERLLYRIPNAKTICHFEAFSFLSERFLLSVGSMTGVSVWDMSRLGSSAEAPNFPCAHRPSRSAFNSQELVCYSMTTDYSTLYVVFQDHSKAIILDLELPSTTLDTDEPKLEFYQSGHVYLYGNHHHIMGIDADSRLALLTYHDDMIEVVDWHWRTECRSLIRLHQEATEVPYSNPVLALRICGPYIVCLRRQSIDAYPMPLQFLKPELSSEQPLPVLQHTMSGMAFTTEVSLSRARHSCFPSGNVYTLYALAEEEHHCSALIAHTPVGRYQRGIWGCPDSAVCVCLRPTRVASATLLRSPFPRLCTHLNRFRLAAGRSTCRLRLRRDLWSRSSRSCRQSILVCRALWMCVRRMMTWSRVRCQNLQDGLHWGRGRG
ncbi:hypothetical protein HD554DRAFT_559784 [Boletus coccyginus]|nr:hypothetical protein HD554DRAFT_559784 [Boletus coccyginus]